MDEESRAARQATDAVGALAALAKLWKERASSACHGCRERGRAEERAAVLKLLNDAWPALTREGRGHEAHTVCTMAQRIERGEHIEPGNGPSSDG